MPPYGIPPPYAAMYAQGTPYQQAHIPPVMYLILLESMFLYCVNAWLI